MAEKLGEATWTAFTKKAKLDLDDAALTKALAKFDKTDAAKPEPRLAALDDVVEQIKKQVAALVKVKKTIGDKPFGEAKDKLYGLLEAAESLQKETRSAASDGDEEADSPVLLTTKMVPLLRELRKGEARMNALICTAGKETALLIMRRAISPPRRKLLAEAVDAKGGAKYIAGECVFENKALTFIVQTQAAGLAKRLRQALLDQTGMRMKVRVRGEDGVEDVEGEDEGEAGDAGGAAAGAEAGSAAGSAAGTTPPRVPPTPPPGGDTPVNAGAAFTARLTALLPRVKAAIAAAGPTANDIKRMATEAGALAGKKDFAAAGALLDSLEAALADVAAGGQPAASPAPAAAATAGSSFVNMQKARLVWLQTRQAVQSELNKLERSILDDFADEPDFADVQRDVRRLDQVMTVLDEELADTLDAALNAADETQRRALQQQAREQADAYGAYVASDAFVADLEDNPFTPIKIRETVTRSLAVLGKALK